MKDLIINMYFNNANNPSDSGLVQFSMQGNSVEEVTQQLLNTTGKYAIGLPGGYKIINLDNVCYIDIIDPNPEDEIIIDNNED